MEQHSLYIRSDGILFRFITCATDSFTQTKSVVCENLDTGEREAFTEAFFNEHCLDSNSNKIPRFRRINVDEEFDPKIGEILRRLHIFDTMRLVPDPWRLIAAALGLDVMNGMKTEQRSAVRHACFTWGNHDMSRLTSLVDGTLSGEAEFLTVLHILSLLRARIGDV